jgi:hypothetical protein
VGPKKHDTWKKGNMMRAIMAVRKREMRLLRASKLREVPKSTFKDKVNSEDQNIEKLRAVNIRSCRKPVLLMQILSSFFFLEEAVWVKLRTYS